MGKNKKTLATILKSQDNIVIEHMGKNGVTACYTSEDFAVKANETAAGYYLDDKHGPENYTEEQLKRTAKMVDEIHEILIRKAPSKSEGLKKYRTGHLRMSSNALALRIAMFETFAIPRTKSSTDSLTVVTQAADAMAATFDDVGELHALKKLIQVSGEVIGTKTPIFQLGDLYSQRGTISDLLTRDEYNQLLWILILTAADPLFDWLYSTFGSEDMVEYRAVARDTLEGLFSLAEATKVKKVALKQFYSAIGQYFAGMTDFIMTNLEEQDKKKASAPSVPPLMMMGPRSQILNKASSLNIAKSQLEGTSSLEDKILAVKTLMPKWMSSMHVGASAQSIVEQRGSTLVSTKPDLTQLGYFFALKDNEIWATSAPAVLMLYETTGMSKDLCREKSERRYQSILAGEERLDEKDTDELMVRLKPAFDLFYEPTKSAVVRKDSRSPANNYQMLSLSGLAIYKPEKSLPRRQDVEQMMKVTFTGNPGISDSLIGAVAAATILARSPICGRVEEAPEHHEQAPAPVQENEQVEEELLRLKAQLAQKEQLLNETLQKNEELEKKLEEREADVEVVKSQKKFLQEEMTQLLETIECMSEETADSEEASEEEVFPVTFDGKKVIAFGGFTSFLVPLQEFLPELLIYQSNRRPEASTLKSADAVFIQTNRISHSDFYYVLDTCRENDVPVQVFKTAGAKSCAMQIMKLVKTLNKEDSDTDETVE